MNLLFPASVLEQVALALPDECRVNVIIIGSLAAGSYFFRDDGHKAMRTKDVDCMFSPHAKAVASAKRVAEQLLASRWTIRADDKIWATPGTADQSADTLPLVRLKPPPDLGQHEWFIELLGAPGELPTDAPARHFERLVTTGGHFGLCSFGFLGLAEWCPIETPFGIKIARPDMMALANLLHHPRIGDEIMSGTRFKRSHKDLGRVLALAHLTTGRDLAGLDPWNVDWLAALRQKYPKSANDLASRAGAGLRELLNSPGDLDEATATCSQGLLASVDVDSDMLYGTGQRVLEQLDLLAEKAK